MRIEQLQQHSMDYYENQCHQNKTDSQGFDVDLDGDGEHAD